MATLLCGRHRVGLEPREENQAGLVGQEARQSSELVCCLCREIGGWAPGAPMASKHTLDTQGHQVLGGEKRQDSGTGFQNSWFIDT